MIKFDITKSYKNGSKLFVEASFYLFKCLQRKMIKKFVINAYKF